MLIVFLAGNKCKKNSSLMDLALVEDAINVSFWVFKTFEKSISMAKSFHLLKMDDLECI